MVINYFNLDVNHIIAVNQILMRSYYKGFQINFQGSPANSITLLFNYYSVSATSTLTGLRAFSDHYYFYFVTLIYVNEQARTGSGDVWQDTPKIPPFLF
jgi:hypothetical protein